MEEIYRLMYKHYKEEVERCEKDISDLRLSIMDSRSLVQLAQKEALDLLIFEIKDAETKRDHYLKLIRG